MDQETEINAGKRAGVPSETADRMKALEREVRELRQADESPARGIAIGAGGARPPAPEVTAFMEADVESYGIEPMCRVCGSPPPPGTSTPAARPTPTFADAGEEDERLSEEIIRVHNKNFGVDGARKVWLQLNREGFKVGRDRVARRGGLGLEATVRGKA